MNIHPIQEVSDTVSDAPKTPPWWLALLRRAKLRLTARLTHKQFLHHHWDRREKQDFLLTFDPVRYAALKLAVRRIQAEAIPGSLAEVGVFRGETGRFLHRLAPDRTLYLFDTFAGFPERDLEGRADPRFRDTSVERVRRSLPDSERIVLRPGYFPDTARGLEHERFALVMLDADLYAPTRAGLAFFYPRLVPGGYLFLHDYHSHETGVARAADVFFADIPEHPVELPDEGGSVIVRKTAPKEADRESH